MDKEKILECVADLEQINCIVRGGDLFKNHEVAMKSQEYGGEFGIGKILDALGIDNSVVQDSPYPNAPGSDFQLLAMFMLLKLSLKVLELEEFARDQVRPK